MEGPYLREMFTPCSCPYNICLLCRVSTAEQACVALKIAIVICFEVYLSFRIVMLESSTCGISCHIHEVLSRDPFYWGLQPSYEILLG
jgi:hypothetical protein